MPEKDALLLAARSENLRLRLMLSALPDPDPDINWAPLYIQWWFRNRRHLRALAEPPDTAA